MYSATCFPSIEESTKNNLEMKRIYYGVPVDDAWKNMLGANPDVSNDIFGALCSSRQRIASSFRRGRFAGVK